MSNDDSLTRIGTGERTVKLGFVEIHVYSLELYVDAVGCRAILAASYSGLDLNGLLRESSFYTDFTSGKFEKRFCLTFCRTLSQEKLVGGFDVPLLTRCSDEHESEAKLLLSKLVPSQGVVQGDVLTLKCHADGETLTGLFQSNESDTQEELVQVKSGGTGGAWLALQNIYFDNDTQLPTIRVSSISQLPNVLIVEEGEKESHALSQQEIEHAVEQEFSSFNNNKKTWSEFAGRTTGKEGYKFGDLTLGVVTAMGLRKPPAKQVTRGELSLNDNDTSNNIANDGDGKAHIIDDLQHQLEQLQTQVQELESENAHLKQLVVDTETRLEAEFPLRIVVALALVEAFYCLLQTVGDVYISSLTKFQLYVVIAIVLGGYKQYMERLVNDKKRKVE